MKEQKPFYTYHIDKNLIALAKDQTAFYNAAFTKAAKQASKMIRHFDLYMPGDMVLGWKFDKKLNYIDFYITGVRL